jgi:hypothetical protein
MDIFEKSTIEAYNQIFERKIKKLNKIKQTIETNLTKNEE